MFHFKATPKLWRNLCLAVAVAIFVAVASCSNQPTNQATSQTPKQTASRPANATAKAATPKVEAVSAKVTQPPQVITLPKGTAITATVGQTLASDKNHQGDSFAASLAAPVKLDGKTVLPKGAHITGRVVTVKKHELKVVLASVVVHGKSYDLATNSLRPSDKDQSKTTAKTSAAADQKQKKDNSTLSAKTQLTFKLAKPVTVPAKG